jgi:D-alanyl-lipoteichoic acid acyltransferase DltB (MBOAT superfamily)
VLFNSFEFLIFFPVVTILFFALPPALRRVLLLAASSLFYMVFIPGYVLILYAIILVDYAAAFCIDRSEGFRRRSWLAVSLVANIGLLAVFKYYNFFNDQLVFVTNAIGWGHALPALTLVLPIGLSFHTFQAMSYTIEVYRGRVAPERNLLTYALYVMFYPQLVAGPIDRPFNLLPQLGLDRPFDEARVTAGLQLMAWGFFKKIVIADRVAMYVNAIYADPGSHAGMPLLVATYLFSVQIYCDFSGYSDIAIGAAEVMGVDLMKNFDRPYWSRSVGEFWRRWHISLSTWFRDYLYLPLGGNRVSPARWCLNILAVFAVSGLWHGANWTFVVWGALHGIYILVSRWSLGLRERISGWLGLAADHPLRVACQVFVTFNLVSFAWIFFRASSLRQAFSIVWHILTPDFDPRLRQTGFSGFELLVALGAIATMEAVHWLQIRGPLRARLARAPVHLRWSLYYGTVMALILFGTFNSRQFIYFQF